MPALNRRALAAQLRSLTTTLDTAKVAVRSGLAGGPKLIRVTLISDEKAYTSEQQFAPITRFGAALRRRFGVVVRHLPVERAMKMTKAELGSPDVVGLKLSFDTPAAEAQRIARHFKSEYSGSSSRLVYFDGDDDLCIQWPQVLGTVDAYVKKHVFADSRAYGRTYHGKSNLTDHVASEHGRSFADDPIAAATGPIDPAMLSKLQLGWNIGLDDKIANLAERMAATTLPAKDIDIASRAFVSPQAWIHPLRLPVVDRLEAMSGRFRVLAPRDRVSQDEYYNEMMRARICVSPFGYGELCWRDFEAILCGCLLVKPDMGHAKTYPDVFVDGETYAAVRWDYADLEQVCARYLGDEPLRRRVADRALAVLTQALTEDAFVDQFAALLRRVGVDLPR